MAWKVNEMFEGDLLQGNLTSRLWPDYDQIIVAISQERGCEYGQMTVKTTTERVCPSVKDRRVLGEILDVVLRVSRVMGRIDWFRVNTKVDSFYTKTLALMAPKYLYY